MNNIKVGDLVTAYWKGYFRVVTVRKVYKPIIANNRHQFFVPEGDPNAGEYYASLVDIVQEYDSHGNPRKSKNTQTCDSSFCKLAIDVLPVVCKDLNNRRNALLNILKNESVVN